VWVVVEPLIARLADGSVLGPLLGLLVGAVLGLSPVALPTLPAVMATVSPGDVYASGYRRRAPVMEAFPSILAFTAGMNGVIGLVGFAFVSVTVGLARASVVLHVVAAVAMAVVGLLLVARRTSVCQRGAMPPTPRRAFVYGIAFSIGGCPGCGPVALAVGAAAAAVGGPVYGMSIIAAFILGHALVLTAAAAAGARLIPDGPSISWRRLDLVVAGFLLVGAVFYLYRVAAGDVSTLLPGESGSTILP
jgi:cytochrome c biogenesis protein CcdA